VKPIAIIRLHFKVFLKAFKTPSKDVLKTFHRHLKDL
jgi:hypothetical protein